MSVVLRCPSCGTTQATPGECETCHEAVVRYFCTNHDPGRWLDGPSCPQCDARRAPPSRPVDVVPPPAPRWTELVRDAVVAKLDDRPPRGWFLQLIRRLALIAVVALVGVVLAVYWLIHSL